MHNELVTCSLRHTKSLVHLLTAGDVEANPGPSSKATRQATLSQSAQGDLTVGEPSLADIMKEIRDCKTDLMVESVKKGVKSWKKKTEP